MTRPTNPTQSKETGWTYDGDNTTWRGPNAIPPHVHSGSDITSGVVGSNYLNGTTAFGPMTLGYAPVTTNQGSIGGSLVDLTGLSLTVTVPAARRIRITGFCNFSSTVADDTPELSVWEGGTQLAVSDTIARPASIGGTSTVVVILTPTAGLHTYRLRAVRAAGSGTVTLGANSVAPSFILVEDITGSALTYGSGYTPVGLLGQAILAVNGATMTTEAQVTGLIVTVAVPAGRVIRLKAECYFQNSAPGAAAGARMFIKEGSTYLQQSDARLTAAAVPEKFTAETFISPSAGSHTYNVVADNGGAGTVTPVAGTGYPAHLIVEDITPTPAQAISAPNAILAYAPVTANQTGITTEVDLTNATATVTVPAGRTLKITGSVYLTSTVADDNFGMRIKEGGTLLQETGATERVAGAGISIERAVTVTPSAGTHTYKLTVLRFSGTGSVTNNASTTIPSFILVEDITSVSVLPTAIVPGNIAATSAARPANPTIGTTFYETDTAIEYVWTGSEWRRISPPGVQLSRFQQVGNTTSATYVDFPGPCDAGFIKRSSSTALHMRITGSSYQGTAANFQTIGLRINGVDYDIALFFFNDLGSHRSWGAAQYLNGLAAGAYTARLRWKVASGSANVDANDLITVEIQEILPS